MNENKTAVQFIIPYFLDSSLLEKEAVSKGFVIQNIENGRLKISKDAFQTILDFRDYFMMYEDQFISWHRYDEGIQIKVSEISSLEKHELFIDVLKAIPGKQECRNDLKLKDFIAFTRKGNLETEHEGDEKYVLVHLHHEELTIYPFGSFNKTGGDPLYMCPAVAIMNLDTRIVYGTGMRMDAFSWQL